MGIGGWGGLCMCCGGERRWWDGGRRCMDPIVL